MGHMKTWWIFGFEWWGDLRPAEMSTSDGRVFQPWILGLWIQSIPGLREWLSHNSSQLLLDALRAEIAIVRLAKKKVNKK